MKHLVVLFSLVSFVTASLATTPVPREWMIEGVKREGLVHVPTTAKTQLTPVVFAFHGHGGNMHNATRMFPIHELWPEAIVVFLQGLNTPGRLTDPEGKKPGWQSTSGILGDRDLKLFDAVLASLRADYRVNDKRIYSTGHSNGGGFTYLLWTERGDVFAAMAPSASAATRSRSSLKPKPVLHIAGENDPLVKYAWQQATIQALLKLNECSAGVAWDKDPNCTLHPSATGNPVVTAIHPGDHSFPKKAPEVIVKFFKEHQKL
jgi:polyhydroxybutyrate depolymerase